MSPTVFKKDALGSEPEITHISSHGIWMLSHGVERFLSYDDFPWFREQPVKSILNVLEPSPGHFYWPDIDVDLGVEMIDNPERLPLKSNV